MATEVKDEVLKLVMDASQKLGEASLAVKKVNPMAAAVPVVLELDRIAIRLSELVREFNRLPGL